MINATIHQPQMALRIVFETFAFNKPKEDIWRLQKKSERKTFIAITLAEESESGEAQTKSDDDSGQNF